MDQYGMCILCGDCVQLDLFDWIFIFVIGNFFLIGIFVDGICAHWDHLQYVVHIGTIYNM